MFKFYGFLFFCFVVYGCHSQPLKTPPKNGTLIVKYYFFDTKTNKEQQNTLIPNTKVLYYKDFIIEQYIQTKNVKVGNLETVISKDSSFYFINTVSGKCDRYTSFSSNATKAESLKWEDKLIGLVGLQKSMSPSTYGINEQTAFADTLIDNKLYKFCIHKKPTDKTITYFVKNQVTGLPIMKLFDKKYGTLARVDRIENVSGSMTSVRLEIKPENLTKNEIQVFDAWEKKQKN
ncbi:hypothetical protein [Solitalea lacus]|uniref:hypothetical protein n=1 Tax=Solitalea lacus TaxID=2911172 RepID=UPI001EDBB7C2|nr:hypothetical protein [Solitalea lacus]UKJ09064.1 hypothetical protein L2B55_07830 [Solitalea lacus]